MSGIRDTATVTLNVNGAQAKQMMSDLEQKIADTKKHIDDLKKAKVIDPKAIESARKEMNKYSQQLSEMKSATEGVQNVLENLSSATTRQLKGALNTLNRQLKDIPPGSELWNSHVAKIKEVKQRLAELKVEAVEQKSIWNKFKEWALGAWPAIDLLNQWGSGIMDIARKAVDAFAQMDQEMANVRKFTGLAAEGVSELNEEFKKMDTRTSREDLNKLAQEAGRLGKTSPEEIMGFVRAADKINVALDDLGEGATLTLSKLTGIFGDEKRLGTEKALLSVGSVINELSQNCAASAPYLAEFASRMGGVGAQAGMTIQQIMGFAAVLDSNEQKVEASSTALSQVIVRMMQDPAKYAKVAGLDVQKFTNMLRTDANSALLLFLDTLQKAGGMETLSPMFKDMGENGSRAIAALSTLATHIDEVKAQQQAANVAFSEAVSIDKEFNVQNTTVQASLEKAKKAVNEIRVELGQHLSPVMSHVISSSSALLRVAMMTIRFLIQNKVSIISLTAGIVAYTVAVNMATIKTAALNGFMKLFNVFMAAQRLAIIASTAVWSLLTGNITRATAAFRLFSAALKANPIGLVVGVIVTAITAIEGLIAKENEAKKKERELAEERRKQALEFRKQVSDTSAAAAEYAKGELSRLKKLYDATQDQTKSYKQRMAAVLELQKTYPTAFGQLTTEAILAGKAAGAYNQLARNIILAAKAKAIQEKIEENAKLDLEKQLAKEDLDKKINNEQKRLDAARELRQQAERDAAKKGALKAGGDAEARGLALAFREKEQEADKNLVDLKIQRNKTIRERNIITEENNKLLKMQKDSKNIAPDITFESAGGNVGVSSFGGTGYTSQVQAEKDAKKAKREREAAARRARTKAKKEFKDDLDSAKGTWEGSSTLNETEYKDGLKSYTEYLDKKNEIEMKYYADREEVYKKHNLLEDEDYQELLKKKAEYEAAWKKKKTAMTVEAAKVAQQAEEKQAEIDFYTPGSDVYNNQEALEKKKFEIKNKYLKKMQAAYEKDSEEYQDYQEQIDQTEGEDRLRRQKLFAQKFQEWMKAYEYKSAKERYDSEMALLEEFHDNKKMSEEEYEQAKKEIQKKYADQYLPDSSKPEADSSAALEKQKQRDLQILQYFYDNGLIQEEEYQKRKARIQRYYEKKNIEGAQGVQTEYASMVLDLYTSFKTLFDKSGEDSAHWTEKLGNAAAAAFAVMNMAMQGASEFMKIQSEMEIAEVEKKYDREIELAEGNSYRVKKAEREKEKAVAKIKADAARKEFAMQLVQAISQTAMNALMAFGSLVKIPVVGPALAAAAAAMATAQGAMQIAIITKQKQAAEAQGYSQGGFTRPGRVDEPAGIVHAGEWVASQKLLANPVARPMIEALDYAQRTNTIGSLKDEDVSRSIRATDSMVRLAESDGSSALMVAAVARNAEAVSALNERLRQPLGAVVTVTGDQGIQRAQDEYDRLLKNKSPKQRK